MHRRQYLRGQTWCKNHHAADFIQALSPASPSEVVFEDGTAEAGLVISEPNMTRYDIYTADECFLTGTAAEVIPVVKLDNRPIGDGKPGPITRKV